MIPETTTLVLETMTLLVLFPLTFLLGKIISKTSEEELSEVVPVALFINKVLIVFLAFTILSYFTNIITTIIIVLMILTYLILNKQSPKEKVMIAITASISILYLIETAIIISLVAAFLKGITTHKKGEHALSKHTLLQTSLFFFMISFKFLVIGIITFF